MWSESTNQTTMEETKFEMIATSSKGRCLVAGQKINKDSIILQESPLVSSQFSWNKAYGYLACDNCMFPLESSEQNVRRLAFDPSIILPYPEADPTKDVLQNIVECPECGVKFCRSECLEEAGKKYHKLMCQHLKPGQPLDGINEIWKKMHYPPETSSVLLVLRIFAMIKQNPTLVTSFNEFCDKAINEDLSICHKLLGEKFTSQISELHQAFVQVFADDDVLGRYLTVEGLTQIFAMIGTNSQGIGTSSFAEWVKNVSDLENLDEKQRTELDQFIDTIYATFDQTVGQFLNNEGSGLYLTQSKINHSCNPNAEIRFPFSNNILQVAALRDIREGEEICISYLDECQLNRSRHSRIKYLQENYLFVCECEKCEEEIHQEDVTSEEFDEDMDDDDDD